MLSLLRTIRRILPVWLGGTPRPEGYTHIKAGTEVSGTLNAAGGAVLVEGTQRGDIEHAKVVFVGADGRVLGTISADEVIVAGTVDGEVVARSRCEVHSTGMVLGAIRATACLWLEGARVAGQVRVGDVAPFGVPEIAPAKRGESSASGLSAVPTAATAIPDAAASRAYRMALGQ
jgi:cytoskeletal protein CcmA (bactofilin family)